MGTDDKARVNHREIVEFGILENERAYNCEIDV